MFITSTGDTPGTNRLEITLEKGKLVSENNKLYLWKLEMSEPEFSRTNTKVFAAPKTEFIKIVTDGDGGQHVEVLNSFAGAILQGTPLIANGEEGIHGLTLSNAIHLSAWLKKEIVLPFDEDLFYQELMKRVKTSRRKEGIVDVVSDIDGSYNTGL